jgi:hypothetical protein
MSTKINTPLYGGMQFTCNMFIACHLQCHPSASSTVNRAWQLWNTPLHTHPNAPQRGVANNLPLSAQRPGPSGTSTAHRPPTQVHSHRPLYPTSGLTYTPPPHARSAAAAQRGRQSLSRALSLRQRADATLISDEYEYSYSTGSTSLRESSYCTSVRVRRCWRPQV